MRTRINQICLKLARSLSWRLARWIERRSLGRVDPKIFEFTDCLCTVQKVNQLYQARHLCDIGAHKGSWSLVMQQINTELKSVVMFEPQTKLIENLKSLELGGVRKTIYQCALGEKESQLLLSGGTASASLLPASENQHNFFPGSVSCEQETVQVRVLDEIYSSEGLDYPDLIKLDVQGYELNVLRGAEAVLANARYLVIEISLQEFYEGQPELWELWKFLSDANYVMVDRGYELRSRVSPCELLQFDGIFVNKRFLQH